MNEKIEEIIEQCSTDVGSYDPYGENRIIKFDKEKFAELIIKECVAEAKDDCAGWTERDQCLVMQVMDRIMIHFGVKE